MPSTPFRNAAVGAGSAAEAVMGTNGSVTIPPLSKLVITDWIMTYQGAGILRIREDSLGGTLVIPHRFSADGEIQGDLESPIEIANFDPVNPKTVVFTEEGSFPNSQFVSGRIDPIGG
jgi:hypothetical protein